jgi:outer membrane biosynthesis protein TonB
MCNLRVIAMAFVFLGAAGCGPTPPAVDPTTPKAGETTPGTTAGSEPTPGGAVGPDAPKEQPGPAGAAPPPSATGPGAAKPEGAMAEGTALTGALTKSEIRAIVIKHSELFDKCYSIGAGKSMQFVATVTIKATIGPSGVVNETQVVKSTAKNLKVDECVADAFKKIKFPKPSNGATSVITFPMEFQGVEEVKP